MLLGHLRDITLVKREDRHGATITGKSILMQAVESGENLMDDSSW